MADNSVSYSGWVWLSKVKEHKDSLDTTFSPSNFHKRKKRYISLFESNCIYRYSPEHKDSKSISLLTLSPLLILGADDLPALIYLIDSVTREIHVIIEPEAIHTTTTLCNILTLVCENSRISTMKQIITQDDSEKLKNILTYCRHTKALMEEITFSHDYGNALHFTLAMKSIQCLPIIFSTLGLTSLSIENLQSQLPVHTAVLTYDKTLIKTFIQIVSSSGLKSNELLNMSNRSLQTPFHMITDEEMIPLLVPYGANLDSFDSNGLTPLMVACQQKLTYVAIEFMDFGVNINKPNWVNGFTPLMYSCLPGNDELVKEFVDRGADIHRVDNYSRTALHHSCMNGHLFSCVLFLNMGINLDLQDLFGATALCYSAASPLHGDVAATHELIGLLIARGSYPKIRDVCGRQALHYAAECGNDIALSLLLTNGADPNAVDHSGKTALDIIENKLDELMGQSLRSSTDEESLSTSPPSKSILQGLMGGATTTDLSTEDCASADDSNSDLRNSSNLAVSLPTFTLQLMIQGLGFGSHHNSNKKSSAHSSASNPLDRYQHCSQLLLSNGAGKRMNANLPIETNCRDMTFSYAKNGTYSVASATPWALLSRLTTFPHFSVYHATSLLSTYRLYLQPIQLLRLIQLRFYMLTNLSEELVTTFRECCESCGEHLGSPNSNFDSLFSFGIFLMNPKDISLFLSSFLSSPTSPPSSSSSPHPSHQISRVREDEETNGSSDSSMNLGRKPGRPVSMRMKQSSQSTLHPSPTPPPPQETGTDSNSEQSIFCSLPEKAINFVKGIDSFVKYDFTEKTLLFRSVYLGKPISTLSLASLTTAASVEAGATNTSASSNSYSYSNSNRSQLNLLERLISSLNQSSSCVELYADQLFFLCQKRFCQLSNCCLVQEFVSEHDWSLKLFNNRSNGHQGTHGTGNGCGSLGSSLFPEHAFNISSVELVCHSVSRLMRGKIIIELRVFFGDTEAIETTTRATAAGADPSSSSPALSINSLEILATHYREVMSELFASCLSHFIFGKATLTQKTNKLMEDSPNSRMSRKLDHSQSHNGSSSNVLHSIESELIHHEDLPSFCYSIKRNNEMMLLQKIPSERQFQTLPISHQMDRAFSDKTILSTDSIDLSVNTTKSLTLSQSAGATTPHSLKSVSMNSENEEQLDPPRHSASSPPPSSASASASSSSSESSVRACLQLLTTWCVDFYEDDFETDSDLKIQMGKFLQQVMTVCHELIEDEFDPNAFAPFLQFETNSLLQILETLREEKDTVTHTEEETEEMKETPAATAVVPSSRMRKTSVLIPKRLSLLQSSSTSPDVGRGVGERGSVSISGLQNSSNSSSRVSVVQGPRGSILSKRLTTRPLVAPKRRGTVLMQTFEEDEYDSLLPPLNSPSSAIPPPPPPPLPPPPSSSSSSSISNSPMVNLSRNRKSCVSNDRFFTRCSSVELLKIHDGQLSLKYNLLELSIDELAEQITLCQHNLFCRIPRMELLSSSSSSSSSSCSRQQLSEFSMHWMDTMISQILTSDSITQVIEKLSYFLNLLFYFQQIRNYYAMFEVITILETTSIYRLKAAWGALESSVLKKYAALKELFSSKCNFKNFRSEMKRHPIAPPCMPYLGLYQKDFIFLNQLPTKLLKTSSSSSHTQHSQQTLTPPTQQTQTQRGEGKVEREVLMINVTKMSSIASKLLELNSYQKIPYHFQENSQIVQIIKAKPRYRTEEEQYQRSLVLEPFAGGAAPTSGGNTSR